MDILKQAKTQSSNNELQLRGENKKIFYFLRSRIKTFSSAFAFIVIVVFPMT
jgi:hypothetical protein